MQVLKDTENRINDIVSQVEERKGADDNLRRKQEYEERLRQREQELRTKNESLA